MDELEYDSLLRRAFKEGILYDEVKALLNCSKKLRREDNILWLHDMKIIIGGDIDYNVTLFYEDYLDFFEEFEKWAAPIIRVNPKQKIYLHVNKKESFNKNYQAFIRTSIEPQDIWFGTPGGDIGVYVSDIYVENKEFDFVR